VTSVFADTFYWIAITNPKEKSHQLVRDYTAESQPRIVTSEEVLTEYLNFMSGRGDQFRKTAVEYVRKAQQNPQVLVMFQTHDSFEAGLKLYSERKDKGYSLTDCISMAWMRRLKIEIALTGDAHFVQEGFTAQFHGAA
jgi:predicted nucleic acid-binding protein